MSEQIKDKARNLELLEITQNNKEEIESQHALLLEQRDAIEVEKEKTQKMLQEIETLFGQQVSKEVAIELVGDQGVVDSKLCQVTVMFLDIRDFTAYADSKLPKEVATFQNIVFSELINIVRANKGIINQIVGDGIMATFGAPVFFTSHITDAVNAGYSMIGKIRELGEEGKIPPIKVGIGLHTGQVLAGNIGNEFRKQYSLTGKTVIIASRIEQLNKTYDSQFLISDDIYKEVKNSGYPISYIDEVNLKGIKQPIEIYRLV
jgi:adenylate cyclase